MIPAIVRFKLPASIDASKAAELSSGSAPKSRDLPGLVRKYYLFDAEKPPAAAAISGKAARRPSVSTIPNGAKMIAERLEPNPRSGFRDARDRRQCRRQDHLDAAE